MRGHRFFLFIVSDVRNECMKELENNTVIIRSSALCTKFKIEFLRCALIRGVR